MRTFKKRHIPAIRTLPSNFEDKYQKGLIPKIEYLSLKKM